MFLNKNGFSNSLSGKIKNNNLKRFKEAATASVHQSAECHFHTL